MGVGTGAILAEVPIHLPEKLPKDRLLLELDSRDGVAADLAGDAGVIGRISGEQGVWKRLSSIH